MKSNQVFFLALISIFIFSCNGNHHNNLKISADQYTDKMKGAWIGQMAGVGWGQPTEFKWVDTYIPDNNVPAWTPGMINQQGNDDLYVEMTFLATLEKYGLDVSIRQAGIDFANTGYPLWAANNAGRENLRSGIAPPESGHPANNDHCDDIDYQIEADYSGILAPGLPNVPIRLGEKFGRLMNYGDGMYGGQFIGGMYSTAFFEKDIEKIIQGGLSCIPSQSMYAQCIRDVLEWHRQDPGHWQITWQNIEDKYRKSPENQKFAAQRKSVWIPIDAKLNGAYVTLGLLYGKGDMDSTIVIALRCGKDSDCNPANAGGILGTVIGYQNLPSKFKDSLDEKRNFEFSIYNFEKLIGVSENLSKQIIFRNGGKSEKDPDGKEYFIIPAAAPVPSLFEPSYAPGPIDLYNRFSSKELNDIRAYASRQFDPVMKKLDLNLTITHCGKKIAPEIIRWNGKKEVFVTSPMSESSGVDINYHTKKTIPRGKRTYLRFSAGHDSHSEWQLLVTKDWHPVIEKKISAEFSKNGWVDVQVDLSDWADKGAGELEISARNINGQMATNYWSGFKLISE